MLKHVLLTHARRYPLMQPQDAVKLLYQSQFGGGHLVRDVSACIHFLQQEYAATPQISGPFLEDIGNSMIRVHLSGLDHHGYTPQQLGQDFIRCAASVHGSMECFLQDLDLLKMLTQQGSMPFSDRELVQYLAGYAAAGYPMVSHSEIYRNTYHPAYRVIQRSFLPDCLQQQM